MNFVYRDDGYLILVMPYWSHEQFLAGVVTGPFRNAYGELVKQKVRVKMGRSES